MVDDKVRARVVMSASWLAGSLAGSLAGWPLVGWVGWVGLSWPSTLTDPGKAEKTSSATNENMLKKRA